MCGRYTIATPKRILITFDPQVVRANESGPRYNVSPMQQIPAMALSKGRTVLFDCQWGFVPRWADDPSIGGRMINARSETAAEKRSFKSAMTRHRCLIPADGFYEWKKDGNQKQPFYIHRRDGDLFAFAGLYSVWRGGEGGEPIVSSAILTTEPNALMADIHNRMPVILPATEWQRWLDTETSQADVQNMLKPCNPDALESYPVSKHVNKPANDDEQCIAPLE